MSDTETGVLMFFTFAKWYVLEREEGRTIPRHELADRIGIPCFQLAALLDHGRLATRARGKVLAFFDLTESDMADRPDFAAPIAPLPVMAMAVGQMVNKYTPKHWPRAVPDVSRETGK